TVAIGGDEAPLLLADTIGHLEIYIEGIDDDAIGIAEGKDVDIDLFRKIGDKARALAVAGYARVVGDGRVCPGVSRHAESASASDAQGKRESSEWHGNWHGTLYGHRPHTIDVQAVLDRRALGRATSDRPRCAKTGLERANLNHALLK